MVKQMENFKEGDRVVYYHGGVRDSGVVCRGDDHSIWFFCGSGKPKLWVKWDSNGSILHAYPMNLTHEQAPMNAKHDITVASAIQFLIDNGYELTIRKVK